MTLRFPRLTISPIAKRILSLTGLLLLLIGGYYIHLLATNNFHAVVPGEVYRSSQPSASAIARLEGSYGIKTILNLRGENGSKSWYDSEIAQSNALGIKHIDFRMNSSKELTPEQALQLIAIMRDAPKPLLIHCQAGADRTGLASALYLAAIAGKSEKVAEGQLSLLYGHIPYSFSHAFPMDITFEKMEPLLGFGNS
ncbi:dual specificity protein phosphatase family protein [Rhizobium sp. BE258]|jgi:protein tyrosine/serine phosphatase|uniref:dual specificity protein phosphatase family protein n=1 Tax=Rhizobium sp. BE258 TaxID=2817722 RepID=UPI000DD71334|nr:dual specificity protein phosphatase family protein [Rhizobium sp. BE258]MDR7146943.1 protein tyrosine/serine phosphatase [Rhizobium sp. BE258]